MSKAVEWFGWGQIGLGLVVALFTNAVDYQSFAVAGLVALAVASKLRDAEGGEA